MFSWKMRSSLRFGIAFDPQGLKPWGSRLFSGTLCCFPLVQRVKDLLDVNRLRVQVVPGHRVGLDVVRQLAPARPAPPSFGAPALNKF